MASSSLNQPGKDDEVEFLVQELLQLRIDRRVKEADRLKSLLLNRHSIQVFYRRDGTIGWAKVSEKKKAAEKKFVWSLMPMCAQQDSRCREDFPPSEPQDIPLFIVTVDTPYYRSRLKETLEFLEGPSLVDCTHFKPIHTIDMLNLSNHPSFGVNRIVFEGWRQILLPKLVELEFADLNQSVFFVAEDDVRLSGVSPGRIRAACFAIFDANPDLHILSLGHSYAPSKPSRRQRRRARKQHHIPPTNRPANPVQDPPHSLLHHVTRGKGLHGATLLAIRHPEGTRSLLATVESLPLGKKCHFDQFLFHSKLHDIGIAFSDPPLVGWAEVSETLTSVGSGCCREGGGRLQQLPEAENCMDIKWVRRTVVNE